MWYKACRLHEMGIPRSHEWAFDCGCPEKAPPAQQTDGSTDGQTDRWINRQTQMGSYLKQIWCQAAGNTLVRWLYVHLEVTRNDLELSSDHRSRLPHVTKETIQVLIGQLVTILYRQTHVDITSCLLCLMVCSRKCCRYILDNYSRL